MPSALSRHGLLLPLLAGALLIAIAEFLPLFEVRAITAVIEEQTSGAHHSYALLLVAIALVPMSFGAVVGGSRPAAVATVVLAGVALAVTLLIDLPDVRATGLTRTYESAAAHPRIGFYVQSLGAVLALVGAVAALVLRPRRTEARAQAKGSRS